ncbi:MAG: winged helix-turn-helix domain-containing protein [Pseudomonadales bacterium]
MSETEVSAAFRHNEKLALNWQNWQYEGRLRPQIPDYGYLHVLNTDDLTKGFQLGSWSVFPNQNLIGDDKQEIHLEPRVMEVLVFLAANQGEVIKRDHLIDCVWKTHVSDEVLSRAISLLRATLKDDPKTPTFIQTIPKVGYRLIHEVTVLPSQTIDLPVNAKKTSSFSRLKISGVIGLVLLSTLIIWPPWDHDSENPDSFESLAEWFSFLDEENSSTSGTTSIAVLPFDNFSETGGNTFYSEGLTDEITMTLSKVRGLKVVARRSSSSFKDRSVDIPTIGKILNVDAILEGSVRHRDDKLIIHTQLISVSDGYVIWSETYDRKKSDVFSIQAEISLSIVKTLQKGEDGASLETPPSSTNIPNMQAYQLFLNGRFFSKLRGEQALRESIQLYQKALAIDPAFSRARIALATSLVLLPFYSAEAQQDMFAEAEKVLSEQMVSNKEEQGEIAAIHAFTSHQRWDFIAAERLFRNAIELAPDNANIYAWYSQHLSNVGRNQDALIAAKRAQELDAVSPVINDRLGISYLWVNDDLRAAEKFALGAQLGFSNRINPGYLVFLLRQHRYHEVRSIIDAIHKDTESKPAWLIDNADQIFLPENRDWALNLANKAETEKRLIMPQLEFGIWILMGGLDQAYETFSQLAGQDRKYQYLEFIFAEEARDFRDDSRFTTLTKMIGLHDYWQEFGEPDYLKEH